MAKFDLKGLLNDRSVPDRQQDQKIVYRNPKDLIPSEEELLREPVEVIDSFFRSAPVGAKPL